MIQGLLTEVIETARGSQAAAAVAAGGTVIPVEDVSDFPETGGTVDIAGTRYEYATVTPGDDGLVFGEGTSEPDPNNPTETPANTPIPATPASAGTLTLTTPLTADAVEDDPVLLIIGAEPASDAYAVVDLLAGDGDAPEGGDTVQVPIAYADRAMFIVGPYDPPLAITVDDALTTVVTVPGARPTIDGSSIINLPPSPGAEPTEPPASSPPVEVHGTADALVVEVTAEFAASTTIDFHISTTSDFTPDETTLIGSARSAVFVITGMPDGSRLVNGTTYYVRAVARNVIGSAPAGPVASGALDPSVVSELVAARLVAGFVLTGSIQVGNITINPESGILIPQSDGGVIHLPADGSIAEVAAHINARSMRVDNDLSIAGFGELVGELTAAAGVSNPTIAPVITSDVPYVQTTNPALGPSVLRDNKILIGDTNNGVHTIYTYDTANGNLLSTATIPTIPSTEYLHGIGFGEGPTGDSSTKMYVLTKAGNNIYLRRLNSTTYAIEATRTVGTYPTIDPTNLLVPLLTGVAYVVYTAQDASYNPLGVRVASFDLTQSAMPQLGSTASITTTPYYASTAAMWGIPNGGTGVLYIHRSEVPDIVAWDVTNKTTFTRASSKDLTTTVPELLDYRGYCAFAGKTDTASGPYFWVLSLDSGRLYKMRQEAAVNLSVAYTWYDGDSANGTHETAPSPTKTATIPAGKWPVVSFPAPPEASITDPSRTDKANRIGVYAANSGTLYRQGYLAVGKYGYKAAELHPNQLATTGTAPTTNGFIGSNSSPGRFLSGAVDSAQKPLVDLRGNGEWRLGTLSGSVTGTASGAGRVQAGVSTYRATASSGAPGVRLGTEATPTVWSNTILRGFSYDSATGTWTCLAGAAGTYLVFAKATWAADTTLDWGCGLQIWKNDAQMGGINDIWPHLKLLGNSTGPVCVSPIEIAVGDRMQMSIWQNSGTAKTPNGVQFYLTPLLS